MAITGDLVLPGGIVPGGALTVRDGLIAAIDEATPATDGRRVDATGLLVAPGLIDLQINGGFGHDFTHEAGSIWDVGARLPMFGITTFLPTVVTSDALARRYMLAALHDGPPAGYRGAMPMGAHFEGPFLSPDKSGAHDSAFLRAPISREPDVDDWSPRTGVRMATLAPELEGAVDLIRALVGRGVVVSAGHSAATRDEAAAGFEAGATYATHLFNAMAPLGHREPGLAGAALADRRVTVGLIADGIHVHGDVIRLAADAAGPFRVSLVTDATAALGMTPGQYRLGGRDVVLDGTSVRLAQDGRLAGSALTADEALRRFRSMTDWEDVELLLGTMTSVPAQLLGLSDRGVLAVGNRADVVVMNRELDVIGAFVAGEQVYGPWR